MSPTCSVAQSKECQNANGPDLNSNTTHHLAPSTKQQGPVEDNQECRESGLVNNLATGQPDNLTTTFAWCLKQVGGDSDPAHSPPEDFFLELVVESLAMRPHTYEALNQDAATNL
ncbi:hypothetical protein NHX12_030229 [Muraenolepis orangiensis]|uniref:Uncharacterized protein n=1 Tax=Muraenolepis orangiensis TaxID=630683 RepID=A0A9Q0E9F5_9TELE|nr:hypothetical protein NHX12_030229 [Muraenolepis orangiensis]